MKKYLFVLFLLFLLLNSCRLKEVDSVYYRLNEIESQIMEQSKLTDKLYFELESVIEEHKINQNSLNNSLLSEIEQLHEAIASHAEFINKSVNNIEEITQMPNGIIIKALTGEINHQDLFLGYKYSTDNLLDLYVEVPREITYEYIILAGSEHLGSIIFNYILHPYINYHKADDSIQSMIDSKEKRVNTLSLPSSIHMDSNYLLLIAISQEGKLNAFSCAIRGFN